MKILMLSPYHSGSHEVWAEGFARHSRHEVALLTLPGQLWKWRMHGGAVTLARRFMEMAFQPDLILADDMLDLASFLALTRRRTAAVPVVLYMHENQLTYPLPEDGRTGAMRRNLGLRERQYVLINWKAMLAADAIWFNSSYHLESFFAALPGFLSHYPDEREAGTIDLLRKRSTVVPLGIDFQRLQGPLKDQSTRQKQRRNYPPLILWNQRWEFDKNPAAFFRALYAIQAEGRPFRLALCGENFSNQPDLFLEAQKRLAGELVHVGFAPVGAYQELLWDAEIVISTAKHEFFGISILEAIFANTFPILPHQLSYPELIPFEFHLACLYQKQPGLVKRLRWALDNREEAGRLAEKLAGQVAIFDWSYQSVQYDQKLTALRADF